MKYDETWRRYNPTASVDDRDYSDEDAELADLLTVMNTDCPTKECPKCGRLMGSANEMCWKCWKSKGNR